MYHHYIIISTSFTLGTRIALHYVEKNFVNESKIAEAIDSLQKRKKMDIGIQSLFLEDKDWESVVEFDSFFGDIKVYASLEEFIKVLKLDELITALDIAKYFLSIKPLTQLQLHKLVYLAYKHYLVEFKEKLFSEKIVAYKYGPVIKEMYSVFKEYKDREIDIFDKGKVIDIDHTTFRIELAKDGDKILSILRFVYDKYGRMTGSELVELTHSKGSPWDTVYKPYRNCLITDEVILAQCQYEG